DKDIADFDKSTKTWLSMVPDWYFKILDLMCKAGTCCPEKIGKLTLGQDGFFKLCLDVHLSSPVTAEAEEQCPSLREIKTYYNSQGADRFHKQLSSFNRVHDVMLRSIEKNSNYHVSKQSFEV
ncbi:unnamed protein product, partial [Didymodactylos carnosus]